MEKNGGVLNQEQSTLVRTVYGPGRRRDRRKPQPGNPEEGIRVTSNQTASRAFENMTEMAVYAELLNCNVADLVRLTCEYLGKTSAGVSCDSGDPVYHQPWKQRNP
jgi:hypothetical protein